MIEVFDNLGETADRYSVRIGADVFTMSENARSPNGVNQYAGDADDLPGWKRGLPICEPAYLPMEVLLAILDRAWEVTSP